MWGRHRQCGEGTDNIGRAQTTLGGHRQHGDGAGMCNVDRHKPVKEG